MKPKELERTIARLYKVAEKHLKANGIVRLGNMGINYLMPSSLNDNEHQQKQICITIDYENCDEHTTADD